MAFCLLLLCLVSQDVVMVNSSWTAGHVRQLWWAWHAPSLVYPPCDTTGTVAAGQGTSCKEEKCVRGAVLGQMPLAGLVLRCWCDVVLGMSQKVVSCQLRGRGGGGRRVTGPI